MRTVDTHNDDPQDPCWGDLGWSDWYALEKTGDGSGLVPQVQGIYRLRCRRRPELIYVGMTERGLRSRIARLRRGVGHSAAACVAEHREAGNIVEVSWVTLPELDKRELMGLEVDLIAACRRRFQGRSPACQFHGAPIE
jgi:hypothetical protein